ncbi:MAG: dTDP-4-dehydrorhamnose 3,5-epimerase, partial [Deltaproteobacteria bacterium]
MKFIETDLKGALIIEPDVYIDNRGFFMETYNRRVFKDHGLD